MAEGYEEEGTVRLNSKRSVIGAIAHAAARLFGHNDNVDSEGSGGENREAYSDRNGARGEYGKTLQMDDDLPDEEPGANRTGNFGRDSPTTKYGQTQQKSMDEDKNLSGANRNNTSTNAQGKQQKPLQRGVGQTPVEENVDFDEDDNSEDGGQEEAEEEQDDDDDDE